MAAVNKIASNSTGLRYIQETTFGTTPASGNWYDLEPNSYADFGAEITTINRNPINPSRQDKFGVAVDLDAAGGFNTDLTQENVRDLFQGFFFADEITPSSDLGADATASGTIFSVADGTDYNVGDILWATGYANAANNGLHIITAISTNDLVVAGSSIVDETAPADAQLIVVGHQFASADVDVVVTGDYAHLTTTFDATGLLSPGMPVWVGGDGASTDFVNTENNGPKRVKSVTSTQITFDKSDSDMVAETGTGLTIQIFFPRVIKNQTGTSIVRRSYTLERTLGAPDDASPSQIQAEYLVGCVPNEMTWNIQTADKINLDLAFLALSSTTVDGATALLSAGGTVNAVEEADAFNTSSDFTRIRMAVHSTSDEAPTPLFAYIQELTLTVNNNLSPDKAISVYGAFDITEGQFRVGGSLTAYFSDVAAISAIQNNSQVTLDWLIAKNNAGIAVDVPLLSLGDGRLSVEQDSPITIPVSLNAATGAAIDANMDHTLLVGFFDYLPTVAM